METLNIEQIKALYPEEWVLVANPVILSTKILSGIVLFHSKDKKEVCYLGRGLTSGYDRISLTFTGSTSHIRKIGVLKRL
jgi:hypothetical protein